MKIGEKIKSIRKQKGYTQSKVGALCGMGGELIGRYERGAKTPKLATLKKIADALEVPFCKLCCFND